jgi:predicted MFS family arabinose efflux permease
MNRSVTPTGPSRRAAKAAFAAMASVYFFSYFQRAALPGTIFNELQTDFGLSAAAVAALGSMFTWIYGGMQIVVGLLADRYGGSRTLMGGGAAMLAGSVLFPLAHTVEFAFAARALTGFGASFMYLSVVKELDRLFGVRQFTTWLGISLAAGYSGGVMATLPFERAVSAFGWRPTLLAVALLQAAALIAAGVILKRLGQEPRHHRPFSLAPLSEVLGRRACHPLLASSLIMFPVFFAVLTVLGKKFLQDVAGLSSVTAAAFMLVMTLISAVGVVLGGWLPRLLHERRRPFVLGGAVVLVLAIGVLLAGTLTHAPGWVYLAGYILLALTGVSLPSSTAVMKELNPPGSVAACLSIMNGLAYFGCGLIGQFGGMILDRYRAAATLSATGVVYPQSAYVMLFAFLAVLAVLNLAISTFIAETHGRHAAAAPPDVTSAGC